MVIASVSYIFSGKSLSIRLVSGLLLLSQSVGLAAVFRLEPLEECDNVASRPGAPEWDRPLRVCNTFEVLKVSETEVEAD